MARTTFCVELTVGEEVVPARCALRREAGGLDLGDHGVDDCQREGSEQNGQISEGRRPWVLTVISLLRREEVGDVARGEKVVHGHEEALCYGRLHWQK